MSDGNGRECACVHHDGWIITTGNAPNSLTKPLSDDDCIKTSWIIMIAATMQLLAAVAYAAGISLRGLEL